MLQPDAKQRKHLIYNLVFVVVCAAILVFLLNAPPETTVKIPYDDNHARFYRMDKKEAEKYCENCHNADMSPLPEGHPPKYRCLFCHKKLKESDIAKMQELGG